LIPILAYRIPDGRLLKWFVGISAHTDNRDTPGLILQIPVKSSISSIFRVTGNIPVISIMVTIGNTEK